jgi:hypothetical protein
MTEYRVVWLIDIDADSPREAAQEALAIQRNPESIATCFVVIEDGGPSQMVDLDEEQVS